jgi:hypothetical protein
MEELYAHLLQRCFPYKNKMEIYTHVLNLLRWVLWSTRPLRVAELDAALSIYQHEGSFKGESLGRGIGTNRLRFQITNLCYPIISIQQDDTVAIVHLTFKYFIQHWKGSGSDIQPLLSQLSETAASVNMAQACLAYLNEPQFLQYQDLLKDITDSATFDARYGLFGLCLTGLDIAL